PRSRPGLPSNALDGASTRGPLASRRRRRRRARGSLHVGVARASRGPRSRRRAADETRGGRPTGLGGHLRKHPLDALVVFVPAGFVAERAAHGHHVLLFLLSVAAIVPLAGLLSRGTESVAAKTGDAVGGPISATCGNLTELVIAITALRAG